MVSPFSPIASCRIIVTFLPQLFEHSKACPPRTLALWGSAISGSGTITTTFSAPARASTAWPRTFLKILSARAWSMTRTTSHSPVRSFLTGRIWPSLHLRSHRSGKGPCSSGFTPLLSARLPRCLALFVSQELPAVELLQASCHLLAEPCVTCSSGFTPLLGQAQRKRKDPATAGDRRSVPQAV